MTIEEFYNYHLERIKEALNINSTIAARLLNHLPRDCDELFCIDGIGNKFIQEKGKQCIEYLEGKYGDVYQDSMVFTTDLRLPGEVMKGFQNENHIDTYFSDCNTVHDISNYINMMCEKLNVKLRVNTKIILMYLSRGLFGLKDYKVIEFDKDNYSLFRKVESINEDKLFNDMIKNEFDVVQKGRKNDEYSSLIISKKGVEYFFGVGIPIKGTDTLFELPFFVPYSIFHSCICSPTKELEEIINECYLEKLLIFDVDSTIFATDIIRQERQQGKEFVGKQLEKIRYIDGFRNVFLNPESELFLGNHDLYLITSNKKTYLNDLLDTHEDFVCPNDSYYEFTSKKKETLASFLEKSKDKYGEIIAFGDDEKDANIYSELGLNYYIVNNYYGYNESASAIISKATKNRINCFRNYYRYDVRSIDCKPPSSYTYNFNSTYFDDVVIYFKNLYNQNFSNTKETITEHSLENSKRETLNCLGYDSLGDVNKNDFIKKNYEKFAAHFDDLYLDDDIILTRVLSHSEIEPDDNKPMSLVLKEIVKRHNKGQYRNDIFKKNSVTSESKEGTRHISKHLNSTFINDDIKQDIKGKTIYLFDDIATTCTSIMAYQELLYRAGAGHVVCFSLARTYNAWYPFVSIK